MEDRHALVPRAEPPMVPRNYPIVPAARAEAVRVDPAPTPVGDPSELQPRGGVLRPGTMLAGRYRIDAVIGEGGMGAVYAATQQRLGRRVAIKVLLEEAASSARSVARFLREAEAVSRAQHPNIVQLSDFHPATDASPPFMVMELLEGQNLHTLAARGRMAIPRACRIATQLLSALGAAHRAGIVHRDIKPSNIMVIPLADGSDCVKLLDFGVAKLLDAEGERLTQGRFLLGTARYASPEQVCGAEVDARSDLFSVGSLLYRLLTGRDAFEDHGVGLLEQVAEREAPDPRRLVLDLDERLAVIIDRAMRKDPRARFQSAHEMIAALSAFMTSAPAPERSGPRARLLPTIVMRPREIAELRASFEEPAPTMPEAPHAFADTDRDRAFPSAPPREPNEPRAATISPTAEAAQFNLHASAEMARPKVHRRWRALSALLLIATLAAAALFVLLGLEGSLAVADLDPCAAVHALAAAARSDLSICAA